MGNYRPIASVKVSAVQQPTVEKATGICLEPKHHVEIAHRLTRLREGIPHWLRDEIDNLERLLRLR